ncbi:hypothetical protein ACIO3O_41045 [Streptomyces sp. NPDC087440]|uniref:hypothetical protein n=1 Tax=Streptomyces sp. NPDC087440 TaxID=3365790 RepID=UPI00380A960C
MTNTTHHTSPSPTPLTRAALVAGPVALGAYGVIRLLSERGTPSAGWTAGHLAMLVGVLLFVPVMVWLRGLAPEGRRLPAAIALGVGLVGAFVTAVQAVIDLVAGLVADDRAGMVEIFQQVKAVPGVEPVVYGVVPPLFFVGVIALAALTSLPARTRVVMAGALTLGTVLMALDLNFLALGGLCFLLALAPLAPGSRVAPLPRTN